MLVYFLPAVQVLCWKAGFWSSKMTLRFRFIHWSIHDVAYIWTTSRFHHLSNFVFLRSPVSTPWAFYPQLFSSHFWYLRWDTFQTSLFACSYVMNTSVHVFPLEARPQFTRATLYTCFQNCRICDSVAHSIGTFVTMRLCNVIRARPFHFGFHPIIVYMYCFVEWICTTFYAKVLSS